MSTYNELDEHEELDQHGPIVVGVDGSESSKDALRWASQQATLTHFPMTVVGTWEYPIVGGTYPYPTGYDYDYEGETAQKLDRCVTECVPAELRAGVSTLVRRGSARRVLTELSEKASLVVVGTRGHNEVVGFLAGSVGEFLSTRAHCPVLIVRSESRSKVHAA